MVAGLARRDRRVRPFFGFAVAALLLVAGFLPVVRVIYAVPLLRVPAWPRLLPVGCLGIAIAAAFGWDLVLYGRGTGGSQRFRSGRSGAGRRRRGGQAPAAPPPAAGVNLAVRRSPGVGPARA